MLPIELHDALLELEGKLAGLSVRRCDYIPVRFLFFLDRSSTCCTSLIISAR